MFTHLVTHSGIFHADDLFAAAALRILSPNATLVRTRDVTLATTLAKAGGIVFDVGMVYDHEQRLYDHHQADRALRTPFHANDPAIPYSAFGLIWKHYGLAITRAVLGPNAGDKEVHNTWEQVDRRLVVRIDMGDNGVIPESESALNHPLSLGRILETFLPPFDAPDEAINANFETACAVASALLRAKIVSTAGEERAFLIAKSCVRNRVDPRWIELPTGMPYLGAIRAEKAEGVLYALMPNSAGNEWILSAVRKEKGEMGCRKPLPTAWAGLRDQDLEAVSGVPDVVFCHLGRFMAATRTRDAAMALLTIALETEDSAQPV